MTPLKAARLKKGWTQRQAARVIDINPGNYHRIENNVWKVGPEMAQRIALAFGNLVTRDQLLFPEDYAIPDEDAEAKAS